MSSSVGRASFELDGGREGRVAGRVGSCLPGRFGAFPLVTGAQYHAPLVAVSPPENGTAAAELGIGRGDDVPTAGFGVGRKTLLKCDHETHVLCTGRAVLAREVRGNCMDSDVLRTPSS